MGAGGAGAMVARLVGARGRFGGAQGCWRLWVTVYVGSSDGATTTGCVCNSHGEF